MDHPPPDTGMVVSNAPITRNRYQGSAYSERSTPNTSCATPSSNAATCEPTSAATMWPRVSRPVGCERSTGGTSHSLAGFMRTCAVLPLVSEAGSTEDESMSTVHCPRHGSEVLLNERRIVAIEPDDGRLTVRWVCWCGYQGSHRTGRARRPTAII